MVRVRCPVAILARLVHRGRIARAAMDVASVQLLVVTRWGTAIGRILPVAIVLVDVCDAAAAVGREAALSVARLAHELVWRTRRAVDIALAKRQPVASGQAA